jgi:hypothetical protein
MNIFFGFKPKVFVCTLLIILIIFLSFLKFQSQLVRCYEAALEGKDRTNNAEYKAAVLTIKRRLYRQQGHTTSNSSDDQNVRKAELHAQYLLLESYYLQLLKKLFPSCILPPPLTGE